MIVQCPSCAAKFRVANQRIKPQGVKVRCGRCKTVFRVRRSADSSDSSAAGRRGSQSGVAEGDNEATRVVYDPVAEALDDAPSDLGNALLRTGQTWPKADSMPDDDSIPRFTESGPGRSPALGVDDAEPEEARAEAEADADAEDRADGSDDAHDGGSAPVRSDGRPAWLITGSAGDYVADAKEAEEAAKAERAAVRAQFRPPVTEEHPPRGPSIGSGGPSREPGGAVGPQLTRRDALASLSDPMHERDLSWDVEGDTAPRLPFDASGASKAVTSRKPTVELSGAAPPIPVAAKKQARASQAVAAEGDASRGALEGDEPLTEVTFSHRSVSKDERMAVWLGSMLGVVLVAAGLLAFVAAKNDWLLDFRRFDQMLGVAFAAGTYEPRVVRTVRVYDLEGERIEEPVAPVDEATADGLVVRNLEQSVYRTQHDVHLLLVEGDLLNGDTQPHRAVFVAGRLLDSTGEVASVVAPVGRTLSPEELESVSGTDTLDTLYGTVAEEASALVINPGQRSRFCLVFAQDGGRWDDPALRYQVDVSRSERIGDDGAWRRVVYSPGEPGEPAEARGGDGEPTP